MPAASARNSPRRRSRQIRQGRQDGGGGGQGNKENNTPQKPRRHIRLPRLYHSVGARTRPPRRGIAPARTFSHAGSPPPAGRLLGVLYDADNNTIQVSKLL